MNLLTFLQIYREHSLSMFESNEWFKTYLKNAFIPSYINLIIYFSLLGGIIPNLNIEINTCLIMTISSINIIFYCYYHAILYFSKEDFYATIVMNVLFSFIGYVGLFSTLV